MPSIDLRLQVQIDRTPKVMQVEGMFDLPQASESTVELKMDIELDEKPWAIGLITGPSGCGKSSVARELFGDSMIEGYEWDENKAIVDGFGELGVHETVRALSSVGFSSPPAWLRPYRVLSNGERFRVNLARALVDERELVAIDEFSSVVDRTVARIGSAAVAKQVRRSGRRLVAISCHDDLVEWLQPDWILEPHVGLVTWRSVQPRPAVEVDIVRCSHAAWPWFAPHHYLSRELASACKCFLGLVDGRPATFGALLNFPHPVLKKTMRYSRQVVLPDFQGASIGRPFSSKVCAIAATNGYAVIAQAAHPAIVASWTRSGTWEITQKRKLQEGRSARVKRGNFSPSELGMFGLQQRRMVASLRYIGGPVPRSEIAWARMLWNAQ